MVILEKRYAEEMVAHAKAEAPNEACGLLAGKDGRGVKVYRCRNREKSPYRYNIDPIDFLKADQEMGEQGWHFLGIYHSHTMSKAYPSKTDIELADRFRETMLTILSIFSSKPVVEISTTYEAPLYLIVSLVEAPDPVIRGFRIVDGRVDEEELKSEG